MDTLAQRLREERARLGLTQEQLARLGGVARSAQANYEKGGRMPDATYLAAVTAAGVDLRYIVTGSRTAHSSLTLSHRAAALIDNFELMADEDKCALERFAAAAPKSQVRTG